jgi:microcystin-dependent protein
MADRRAYAGGSVPTELAAGVNTIATLLSLVGLTGYPSGAQKWYAVVDENTVDEEKVLVTNVSGFDVTVTRGVDGTVARDHSPGASFRHCFTAVDADEANAHVTATENEHGLPVGAAFVGTTGAQTLTGKAMDGAANTFTNLPTSASPAIIAEIDAEEAARIAADNLRYTKTESDSLFQRLLPVGSVTMYGGAAAPSAEWLLCDGTAVSRTTYATLFAVLGTSYGAGNGSTTFNLPDMRDRFPRGIGPDTTRGEASGSQTRTLLEANLPPHAHAIDHDHAAFDTASGGGHSHTQYFSERSSGGTASLGRPASAGEVDKVELLATLSTGTHTHNIDVPALTGSSGNGAGSSTPVDILNPFLGINFIIKAL